MPSKDNYALIEGEWKHFTIKRITSADCPRVLEHIRKYFILEEPTCKLLGYTEIFANQLLSIVQELLKQNLSFLVEETHSHELAAVRITLRQTKDSDIFDELLGENELDWKTDIFLNSIDLTEAQKHEIFAKYGIEEYAELLIVAVNPKYRNQGLSMELYKRSLRFLKAEGFKLIKCILTNPTTRRAGSRLGFEELCKIDYKLLKDKTGKCVFPAERNILTVDHYAAVTIKQI